MSVNTSNSGGSKKWKASSGVEKKKLSVAEKGWNLAGTEKVSTRTRGRKQSSEEEATLTAADVRQAHDTVRI